MSPQFWRIGGEGTWKRSRVSALKGLFNVAGVRRYNRGSRRRRTRNLLFDSKSKGVNKSGARHCNEMTFPVWTCVQILKIVICGSYPGCMNSISIKQWLVLYKWLSLLVPCLSQISWIVEVIDMQTKSWSFLAEWCENDKIANLDALYSRDWRSFVAYWNFLGSRIANILDYKFRQIIAFAGR